MWPPCKCGFKVSQGLEGLLNDYCLLPDQSAYHTEGLFPALTSSHCTLAAPLPNMVSVEPRLMRHQSGAEQVLVRLVLAPEAFCVTPQSHCTGQN